MDKQGDRKPQHETSPVEEAPVKNEGLAKNPNPRANENIDTSDREAERTTGAGTEITDGEAG